MTKQTIILIFKRDFCWKSWLDSCSTTTPISHVLLCCDRKLCIHFCSNSTIWTLASTRFKRIIGSILKPSSPCGFTESRLHTAWPLVARRLQEISLKSVVYLLQPDALRRSSAPLIYAFFFLLSNHYSLLCKFNYSFLNEPSIKKPTFPQLISHKLEQIPHDALLLFYRP